MKFLVAPLPFTAAFLAAATPPQNVRQDVGRLTLLPGPTLTAPAKGAPQPQPVSLPTPGMVTIGAEPTFRFVPGPRPATPKSMSPGTLTLSREVEKKNEFAPAPKPQPKPPQSFDALRFDEQLPAAPQPSLLKKTNSPPSPAATPPTPPR